MPLIAIDMIREELYQDKTDPPVLISRSLLSSIEITDENIRFSGRKITQRSEIGDVGE